MLVNFSETLRQVFALNFEKPTMQVFNSARLIIDQAISGAAGPGVNA